MWCINKCISAPVKFIKRCTLAHTLPQKHLLNLCVGSETMKVTEEKRRELSFPPESPFHSIPSIFCAPPLFCLLTDSESALHIPACVAIYLCTSFVHVTSRRPQRHSGFSLSGHTPNARKRTEG